MARFIATKMQIREAQKKVKKMIKEGATQRTLARLFDTHQTIISKIMKGENPSNRIIKEILEA
jgi:predicted transcriptional regulator